MSDIDNDDIRRLDGGLLLVFRELARRRRTTLVAAHLGLSQSAVSHALARLRDLFGDPLFLRRPHGLEPTPRALTLAPTIEALIEQMGAALATDAGFDASRSDRWFRLAVTEFGQGVIEGAFVERLRRASPKGGFVMQQARGYVTLDALRRGQIYLALGRFDAVPTGLAREPLLEDRYCVVARAGHPDIDGSIDAPTWRRAGHIYVATITTGDAVLGPAVGEDPIPSAGDVSGRAIVPNWETALHLVATSDAIATLPRRRAEAFADLLGLQVLTPPLDWPPWTVSLARRIGADPGLDWFCDQLRASVT